LEGDELKKKLVELGIETRGAPEGLLTIRLVFDPKNKKERETYRRVEASAAKLGVTPKEYVWNLVLEDTTSKFPAKKI